MRRFLNQHEIEELETDLLLQALYRITGFDFQEYMRSSISRRIQFRMQQERLPSISSLIVKTLHEEGFADKLLNDFSINVTEMFRDPLFFASFRENVVPYLKSLPEVRIWHAGCSTGEEVFSMAILLKEEGLYEKTNIYATDMNEHVLNKAKTGSIDLKKMQSYTKNYIQAGGTSAFSEYYTTDSEKAILDERLLENVVFAQHNLVTDHSFNEFHVIVCRNVLIYFNPELQQKVNQLFYDSLSSKGFLCLGQKETLRPYKLSSFYEDFDHQYRIYQKK
ncbi:MULTISPECIES: protein-glutamate O-methyltransferase CheR [unclassified Bacillus (in: firmicutes)]|uniref:CheR family methyltransferase n=1 Tax=unclassified Bacillus (in: firmicutes) TaxID=185979 RepID=UPI0008E3FFD2|nr:MULTISPECIES: protein-glutamate O-methyltransferase CheR [unclassified Bacillus (in: firmicutes)]SFA87780.1 chemotaxis protein methyltransferase CheR [Bacillus sp. UNCCL13]SFQ84404.1 chemotaxis protein methyltransferase CheR [Bacillus sp. cl95]